MAKINIGWREWVCLPKLGIDRVKAKVDTGARSSSLHAVNIEVSHGKRPRVRFVVHPLQDDTRTSIVCSAPLLDERIVRSSNGRHELRPTVITTIDFAGQVWPIELTLTSRTMMGFRMLLGREAIRSRFLVDAGRSFLGKKLIVGQEQGQTSKRRTSSAKK